MSDVRQTAQWYERIGFTVSGTHDCGNGELDWARLTFGETAIMLNIGGKPSQAERREVDLYLEVDQVDEAWSRVASIAEVVEPPHDTEYGMREFIVRDLNGFWITFGQQAKQV
ncbi:MAG TPA: VOC family protein [Opitutus sp.]|nr:VOC family protein [Opitutus sp.]